jgi:hypothetical protein
MPICTKCKRDNILGPSYKRSFIYYCGDCAINLYVLLEAGHVPLDEFESFVRGRLDDPKQDLLMKNLIFKVLDDYMIRPEDRGLWTTGDKWETENIPSLKSDAKNKADGSIPTGVE